MARKPGGKLERWEVRLVKAMLATKRYKDQDILAFFTRPTRSINHREIAEIRTEKKHSALKTASSEELSDFLENWPAIDPASGLSLNGDELLIKSREAMIAAVRTFNAAGLVFRTELFITTAIIAWTYLLHAWFKREKVDYRYKRNGNVVLTPSGAEKFWELGKCLRHNDVPVSDGAKLNLEFLIDLRNEIEHRSTSRIDDAIGAKLQACCINFNEAIIESFGPQYGLERQLPIALQFVTFDAGQREGLKAGHGLPANVDTMMDAFHERLTEEQQIDPAFSYRVAFVPKVGSKAKKADLAVEFVKPESDEAKEISRVLLKEVDRNRYTATDVVNMMQAEGYPGFSVHKHTQLWQALDAKSPESGFGRQGDYAGQWVWYDNWLARVRRHLAENAQDYQ